ncbi:RNA polymerase I-specific transcription initiation factor rrn3 isoform X2 [Punica granatum]|uniref:RNA polymerase I-specific transcription initiation factor rrn3 isoform X2 n=1 Tax=Punica granatum TaxID=22663 RepID=A0A6P8BV82_PUNGR|nr:RNA polymerase I-specific transcription initiation factor rrn3 isoform X2 [Punica granatum]
MGADMADGDAGYQEIQEVDFTDNELVHHVRNALKSITKGDSRGYDELIGVMHHKERLSADEVAMLVTCLKTLSGAVSSIDFTHHESLLSTIFSMSMWNYVPEIMDALTNLIISLNFIPPYSFLRWLKQPRGLSIKNQVLSRVHSALESITGLVPLAPMRLSSLVVERMPLLGATEEVVMMYMENMFRLESGSIGLLVGSTMLMAVVDRLRDLDLDITWEDILQDDAGKGIFQLELEDMDEIEDEFENDGGGLPGAYTNRKGLSGNVVAKKLDDLLALTFEHLESCKTQGRLNEVFEILLQSFRTTVLTAYKSKFTQFVMFYACALDPENCGVKFARTLADIFTCTDYPPMTRMSAVAYLASYMARGKFISTNFTVAMLRRLVDWCSEYCKIQNGDINPELHRVFYSGCQAIMYVLCFRMRSLVNVPWLKSQLSQMPLESILKHRLNPLMVCLPSVVVEFLRQAKAANLYTVSKTFIFNDVLESELSRAFGGLERLDMFFPFDPCLLKKSDRYIRPSYIFWSMVQTSYEDDEEGSSEEDDEEEAFPERNSRDHEMATSFGEREDFDIDEFDHALNKMSITPKTYKWGGDMQPLTRMPSKLRPSTSPESL